MPVEVEPSDDLPKSVVPSVLRAARLLDAVASASEPLSLTALRRQLALPKSSTLSLCTSLATTGLLRRSEEGTYHLGPRLVDLAHAYLRRTDLPSEFAQLWSRSEPLSDESGVLAVLEGTDVIYIACRNGSRPHGLSFRVGMRLPASCTATGKTMLAALPDSHIRSLAAAVPLRQLTERSHRTIDALLADLVRVRQRGYGIDDEETLEGTYCVGVPIVDAGRAPAAVAVSFVKGADYEARARALIPKLQEIAVRLAPRASMLL
jgi:DNA-binding IclR family transcriptional regulator